MTDLESLSIQYREAERAWERAFRIQHSNKEAERSARMLLVRTRMSLDEAIRLRLDDGTVEYVDAELERLFAA